MLNEPHGKHHQKLTAAPQVRTGLPPVHARELPPRTFVRPVHDPARLVRDPEFLPHTGRRRVHGPEFLLRTPARPVRDRESLSHTRERLVRGPEFLPLDPERQRKERRYAL